MEKENKTQVLEKEEVENLTTSQQQQNDLIFRLGQIEYQLGFLSKQKAEVNNQLKALEGKQIEIAQNLEKKYGQGTVNLESGEFVKA